MMRTVQLALVLAICLTLAYPVYRMISFGDSVGGAVTSTLNFGMDAADTGLGWASGATDSVKNWWGSDEKD